MSIVYEITVNCLPGDKKHTDIINPILETYEMTFCIECDENKMYSVWFNFGMLNILCLENSSFERALIYLHASMKLAMMGKFLYNICPNCHQKLYYPEVNCDTESACKYLNKYAQKENVTWYTEKQIEKISKHMAFITRDEQLKYASTSNSSIQNGSQTREKLRSF